MADLLPLHIAYNFYDRTAPISDGRVVPEGTAPTVTHVALGELFASMITNPTFDVSEMSLSSYVVARARGDRRLTAIPVFLSRAFRANSIYVREGGVTTVEELKGRRVGVPMYQQTAGVWARGMLQDDHGLDLDSVTWVTGAIAAMDGSERQPISVPDRVRLDRLQAGQSLASALVDGDIDAIVSPLVPEEFRQPGTPIRRLFPDYGQRDREYWSRTGLFPIMHAVVIRTEVLEANPWLARSLFDAFSKARDIAVEGLADVSYLRFALPFVAELLDEQLEIFGADPWPYGMSTNRACLETFMRYMGEQGLVQEPLALEDLFADVAS